MMASEYIKILDDGDSLVLYSEVENVLNQCCDCGKWHHIKIERAEDGTIRMTWFALKEDPEIEDPVEIIIEKGK